jgi:hypothetical protein
MTSLLALTALLSAPEVTLDVALEPLADVVARIKMTDVELRVSPALAKVPVAVAAHGVLAEDLLTALATATDAEWKTDGKIRRLTPKPTAEIAERRERRERHLAAFTAASPTGQAFDQAFAESLSRSSATTFARFRTTRDPKEAEAAEKELKRLQEQTPLGRLFRQVAVAPDVIDLSLDMRPEEKLVLSSQPTRQERALPAGVRQAFREFLQEQSLWAHAQGDAFEALDVASSDPRYSARTGAERVLVSLQRTAWDEGVQVNLAVFDKRGSRIGYLARNLFPKPPTAPETPERIEGTIATGDAFRSWARAARAGGEFPWTAPMRDPLLPAADLVKGAALRRKPNAIVVGADGLFEAYKAFGDVSEVPTREVVRRLPAWGMTATETGSWYIARPRYSFHESRYRLDRRALADFVAEARKVGAITSDVVGAYAAAATPYGTMRRFDVDLAKMLAGSLGAGAGSPNLLYTSEEYALHGALAARQRQRLIQGDRASFGQLPARAQIALQRMVYRTLGTRLLFRETLAPDALRDIENSLRAEPAELLPDGIPGDATLTAVASAQEILYTFRPSANTVYRFSIPLP